MGYSYFGGGSGSTVVEVDEVVEVVEVVEVEVVVVPHGPVIGPPPP